MRALLAFLLAVAVGLTAPALVAGIGMQAWIEHDDATHRAQAAVVHRWITSDMDAAGFSTGNPLFDGEWLFGTHQMAGLAFGQLARLHPTDEDQHVASMEAAIDALISKEVRAFDAARWGSDPLDDLATDRDHASYLGYTGLVLGLHRQLRPDSRFGPLHDDLVAALERNIIGSPTGLLETYPGEVYPVDNAAVAGALALHAAATGRPSPVLDTLVSAIAAARDPKTGLLHQSVDRKDASPTDAPRGSGTALASYFLGLAELPLSIDLAESVRDQLSGTWLGFGLVREYPRGNKGRGDIDSGPVIAGWGVSSTGFSIACARRLGDDAWLRRLGATATVFGGPSEQGWRTGGPLGNAILLAMLTAPERTDS